MADNKSQEPVENRLNVKEWVKLYSDYLYNYTTYRVANSEEARDLVQDTFLSALKAKDTFRGESSEKTWLLSILKRKIIDYYRKRSTQSVKESIEGDRVSAAYADFFQQEGDHENHWTQQGRPAMWSAPASQPIESREFYEVLNKCLSLLPAKWEAVFRMKNMEEQETEQICKDLNVSPSNYWIIMHRAKLQLRKCMELNWFGKAG